jgi:hypothetical protein
MKRVLPYLVLMMVQQKALLMEWTKEVVREL